jgi:hypothetical protein
MTSYTEIADHLNAVPWDVLLGCRLLVKRGLVREGEKRLRGHFELLDVHQL